MTYVTHMYTYVNLFPYQQQLECIFHKNLVTYNINSVEWVFLFGFGLLWDFFWIPFWNFHLPMFPLGIFWISFWNFWWRSTFRTLFVPPLGIFCCTLKLKRDFRSVDTTTKKLMMRFITLNRLHRYPIMFK